MGFKSLTVGAICLLNFDTLKQCYLSSFFYSVDYIVERPFVSDQQ